jgi:hypothetical protein
MSMHEERLTVVGDLQSLLRLTPEAEETPEEFAKRLALKANTATDDDWATLENFTQRWVNNALTAIEKSKEFSLPTGIEEAFPEIADEVVPQAEPRHSRALSNGNGVVHAIEVEKAPPTKGKKQKRVPWSAERKAAMAEKMRLIHADKRGAKGETEPKVKVAKGRKAKAVEAAPEVRSDLMLSQMVSLLIDIKHALTRAFPA